MSIVIEPSCNPYLPKGQTRVDAILKVKASFDDDAWGAPANLEYGIILDNSGSMNEDGRMAMAKLAARGAVARIPDGVRFFVIAFSDDAHIVYPAEIASAATRAAADLEIAAIKPRGGTSMASALILASAQFSQAPGAVRIAHMFTDGDNRDYPRDFASALAKVEGRFQCECRGIGADWKPAQLLEIAQHMLGTAKLVASGVEMERDLRETFAKAVRNKAGNVVLRLIAPPKTAAIVAVKQMSPTIIDLTSRGVAVDERTHDYPTGAWGSETRDFQVTFSMKQAGEIGEQIRIARTAVVVDGQLHEQPAITVAWSDDDRLTAMIDANVAHYTGQAELAHATKEGVEALARGDQQTATVKLGRAVQLAEKSGNDEATARLARVVDVVDAAQGTVRLRAGVQKTDILDAEVSATRTVRRQAAKTPPAP